MKHPLNIKGFDEDMKQLVEHIGDLRYDALAEFFRLLSDKIDQDGQKDLERGRTKLAETLKNTSKNLHSCEKEISKAWTVCKPYM